MLRLLDRVWYRRLSRQQLMCLGGALLVVIGVGLVAWLRHSDHPQVVAGVTGQALGETTSNNPVTAQPPAKTSPPKKALTPTAPMPKPVIAAPSPAPQGPPFMFGVGAELDDALNHRITKEAPIKLLTSWYNGPNDLGFMNGWRTTTVPQAYAAGYTLHLIIYNNDAEQDLTTPYGAACGRPYPLSAQFLGDMQQLAQNFSGGKLYVSMFTELQTYPCSDNTWAAGQNYYRALKDQYLAAMDIFHRLAPGSQVSLGWGGWQANWDDPGQGGGRSLLGYFADVMNKSDFQSFQAMATDSNLAIITGMTKALRPYRGGVMVAHYKPDDVSQKVFDADMKNVFTPANMAMLQQNELFAFSFMDPVNMNSSESAFQTVKNIVQTYAR